jgi:hypothetical protein
VFALYVFQKAKFDFDQRNMEWFRRKIAQDLIDANEMLTLDDDGHSSDHSSDVEFLDDYPSAEQHQNHRSSSAASIGGIYLHQQQQTPPVTTTVSVQQQQLQTVDLLSTTDNCCNFQWLLQNRQDSVYWHASQFRQRHRWISNSCQLWTSPLN